MMNNVPKFRVYLGDIARTILYEDTQGTTRFSFDMETIDGHKTIILERGREPATETKRLRKLLASDKITQYLLERGYHVTYYDG